MQAEIRLVSTGRYQRTGGQHPSELRRKDIPVSDRTYFNYSAVVQAEAWLCGRDTVIPADMAALVNYLWTNRKSEIIRETIRRLTETLSGIRSTPF
ncbi:MAG: hypothetical protein ACLS8R_10055 [Anaeromassilibacillus sp.]